MASFYRFADLPYDVRRLVWQWYLTPAPDEPPRVVEIDNRAWSKGGKYSTTPPPTIFSVCSDARTVGLQFYRPSFPCCRGVYYAQPEPESRSDRTWTNEQPHICRPPVWVNFDFDAVRIKVSACGFYSNEDFMLIQRLQLVSDDESVSDFTEFSLHHVDLPLLRSVDITHT